MVGHIAALQTSTGSSGTTSSLKLEPGMEVHARVVASGPDNVLRLAVGKETVEVQASAPLPKGTDVTLKVSGEAARPQIEIFTSGNRAAEPPLNGTPSSQPPTASQAGTATAPLPSSVTTSSPSRIITSISPQPLPASGGAVPPGVQTAVAANGAAAPVPAGTDASAGLSEPRPQAQNPASVGKGGVLPTPTGQTATFSQHTGSGAAAPTGQVPGAATATATGQPIASGNGSAASVAAPENAATPTPTVRVASGVRPVIQPVTQPGTQTAFQAGPGGAQQGPASAAGAAPPQTASAPVAGGPAASGAAAASPASASTAPVPAGPAPGGQQPGVNPGQAAASQPANVGPGTAPGQPAPAVSPLPPNAGAPSGPAVGQAPLGPPVTSSPGQAAALGSAAAVGHAAPSGPTGLGGQIAQPAGQSGSPVGSAPPGGSSQSVAPTVLPGQAAAANPAAGGPAPAAQGLQPGNLTQATGQGSASQPQAAPASTSGLSGAGISLSLSPAQVSGRLGSVYPQAVQTAGGAGAPNTRVPVSQPLTEAAGKLRPGLESQQASVAGVFGQIGALSAAASAGKIVLPEPVKQVMQQIFGLRLGGSAPVTGKGVEQAVKSSGLFRENVLAQGAKPEGADLKSLLGQLRGLLDGLGIKGQPVKPFLQPPVPSLHHGPKGQKSAGGNTAAAASDGVDPKGLLTRLMQDTDSALSGIRLTQMVSRGLGGDDAPGTQASHGRAMDVVMDLPLAVGQETAVLQMQIGRDPENDAGEEGEDRAWRLRFGLDLTATGPLEAAISLRGGGTYVSLWVEREETHRNLGAQRETIEAAFADAGLDLQELRFVRGLPIQSKLPAGARVDRQS